MVRLLALVLLLIVGLAAIAIASIGVVIKLIGALIWIALAFGAYRLLTRSRHAP